MTDTQAQILIKQLRCEHKVSRGGNDYLSCDECGFEWDYRKIASGKEAAETMFLFALSAERDAATEQCCKDVCEYCAGNPTDVQHVSVIDPAVLIDGIWTHVLHWDGVTTVWTRVCKAAAIRSRVAAQGEK